MKCWAVRKFLPLYVGDQDLPFFHASVKRHVANCTACSQLYQQYLASRKLLTNLKTLPVTQPKIDESWHKIQQRLPQSNSNQPGLIWQEWLPVGALGILLVTTLAVFTNEFMDHFTSPGSDSMTPNISTTIEIPSVQPTALPARIVNILRESQGDKLIQTLPFYELDEARPLEKLSGSF